MADQDRERELEKLSLGKPSLFPRRRKKDPVAAGADEPPFDGAPAEPTEPTVDRRTPAPDQTAPLPAAGEPASTPQPEPVHAQEPVVAPEPGRTSSSLTPPGPVEPAAAPSGTDRPWWARARAEMAERDPATHETTVQEPVAAGPEPAEPREPWVPPITGFRAVAAVGLVAGLLIVGLTVASLRLCEAVRGTASCGGAGYLFLFAIVVAVALLGGLALARLGVSDPRGTSALAVAVIAVVVLLVLIPVIFSWTMVLVIPAISVLAYLGSHWLTTVTDEQPPAWEEPAGQPPRDAVRR